MPKFTFALEPLLKARRLVEQSHQRIVAQIDQQRIQLEDTLRRQQVHITQGKQSLQGHLVGKIDTHALRMHASASIHLMREAQRIVLELAGTHRRLEAARVELIEAARRRRAVELLRERRFEQWKADQDKAETTALDELAVIAAGRTSRSRANGMFSGGLAPPLGADLAVKSSP